MVLKVLFAAICYHLCYENFIFFLAHDFYELTNKTHNTIEIRYSIVCKPGRFISKY